MRMIHPLALYRSFSLIRLPKLLGGGSKILAVSFDHDEIPNSGNYVRANYGAKLLAFSPQTFYHWLFFYRFPENRELHDHLLSASYPPLISEEKATDWLGWMLLLGVAYKFSLQSSRINSFASITFFTIANVSLIDKAYPAEVGDSGFWKPGYLQFNQ